MPSRRALPVWFVLIGFGIFGSAAVGAEEHQGIVSLYHIKGSFPDARRGPCIQMRPPINVAHTACLWKDNAQYAEIKDLLLNAFIHGKACRIVYQHTEDGNGKIDLAECMLTSSAGSANNEDVVAGTAAPLTLAEESWVREKIFDLEDRVTALEQ